MRRFYVTLRDVLTVAVAGIATIALASSALPARAAIDTFVSFEGPSAPNDQLQIDSVNFGAQSSPASGGGSGTGKSTTHPPVTITRTVDKLSPVLMQANVRGQHFTKMHIFFGGKPYVLDDVVISSIVTESRGESPKETITVVYSKMEGVPEAPAEPIAPTQIHPMPINPAMAPLPSASKKP